MSEKTLLASMTGFARRQGEVDAISWTWELRSVNGRGLDIKLRLPNGLDVLELPLRDLAAKRLKRGNVSGTLTIKREAAAGITADLAASGAAQGSGHRPCGQHSRRAAAAGRVAAGTPRRDAQRLRPGRYGGDAGRLAGGCPRRFRRGP